MHMVEHTRRNWLSDAPEGREGGGNFFSGIGEGYYVIIHVEISTSSFITFFPEPFL